LHRSIAMALVIGVLQQKGGVGKTTLAASLYAHAVCAGYETTLVDMDGQGNATVWALGWDTFRAIPQHGGAEAITIPHGPVAEAFERFNRTPAARMASFKPTDEMAPHVWPCTRLGAGHVVPANPYMTPAKVERMYLDMVPGQVVIVDTPPRVSSSVMRDILEHAHAVFAPVQPEANAVQAVPDLVTELQHNGGCDLLEADALRLVVNMRQRCANHEAWETALRRDYGRWVSDVVIPRATAWAEMFNPHAEWKPKTTVGKTAAALWGDVERIMERKVAA